MKSTTAGKKILERIYAGDEAAWRDFVREHFRTVANFLARIIKDPIVAGRLTSQTFARALDSINTLGTSGQEPVVWLLHRARDCCFDGLTSTAYNNSVFHCGQDVFSSPPALRALPLAVLDSNADFSPSILSTIYDGIRPEHELFLELLFLEGIAVEDLAGLFEISANLARSFLFSIFSELAELSSLEHNVDCIPDLFLCFDTIKSIGDSEALKQLVKNAKQCKSCRKLIFRTMRLAVLFSSDTRPEVAPDERLLDELAPSRGKKKKGKVSTFVPIPVRQGPHKSSVLVHSVMPALMAAAFLLLLYYTFQDRIISTLSRHSPARHSTIRARTGRNATHGPATIGTMSGPGRSGLPVFEGQEVYSPLTGQTSIHCFSGLSIQLERRAVLRIEKNAATLVRGRVRFDTGANDSVFRVATREFAIETKGRSFYVEQVPGHGSTVGVIAGQLVVTLRNGVSLELDQDQEIHVSAGLSYTRTDGAHWKRTVCGEGRTDRPQDSPKSADLARRLARLRKTLKPGIHRSPDISPPRYGFRTPQHRQMIRGVKSYF